MPLKPSFTYFLLAVMLHLVGFSQEKLVLNDSTKLEVNVTEVGESYVKYKLVNNPNGPLYTIDKTDLVRITYKNGLTDVFVKTNPIIQPSFEPTANEKKPRSEQRLNDWLWFNIDAGMAFYQSFNFVPNKLVLVDDQHDHEEFKRNSKSGQNLGVPYFGLNFMCGNNNKIKHLIGISYMNVITNYDYSKSSSYYHGRFSGTFLSVMGNYHIVNLNNGLDFKLGKKLNLCLVNSISFNARSTTITNGYSIQQEAINTSTVSSSNSVWITQTNDSTPYVNIKSEGTGGRALFSFQIKMNYDFRLKENVFGAYVLGNYALFNRLTYWSFGLTWYPFKKLRKGFVNTIGN